METLDFLLVTVAVEVVLVSAAMAFAIRATCSFSGPPLSLNPVCPGPYGRHHYGGGTLSRACQL